MNKKQLTATTLGLALLISSTPSAFAAVNKAPAAQLNKSAVVHTINNLSPVKLTSKSTIRLSDINVLSQDSSNVISYTLTIANNDTTSLNLLDYWTKVKTVSGTVYSPTLITADKEKKTVAPGSTLTLTYVVTVPRHIGPSSLIFQVVKWDFSKPNYENILGAIKIPASYLLSTPANYSKTLRINDTPVKLKVNQVTSFLSGAYNYVGIELNVQNTGYKLLDDPKLKFVVKTASGSNYPLTADTSSTGYQIQPQDNKTLKLMASVPKAVSLKNLELQVIQEDETAKTSLPIATMQLTQAKNQSVAVKPNMEKKITLDNGSLAASINGAWLNQSYGESDLSIQFTIRNSGNQTVTVPKYDFALHTATGYTVPVTTTELDSLKLSPQESKTFRLNVTAKSEIAMQSLQLFVNAPQQSTGGAAESNTPATSGTQSSFSYPVGIFEVPEPSQMLNTLGSEQFMQTTNGLVGLTLSSIQRLPWSDGDLVSAKISVANHGNKTVSLPELAGQFKVDSATLSSDIKLVQVQNSTLLGFGKSADLYVVGKIPANLDVSQLQIALLEKKGDNTSEWFRFTHLGEMPELTSVERGKSYKLNDQGRDEEVKELKTVLFTGVSSDILYTELSIKNLENHQIDPAQLVGYYQDSFGQSYQTQVVQLDTPTPASGSGIVELWAKVPKSKALSSMQLVIGEGITDNKLTAVKGTPNGYINATSLGLQVQSPGVNGTLKGMTINPYSLDITNMVAYLSGSSNVQVTFNYNLSRNDTYQIGEFTHKYLIELKDSTGAVFEKEVTPETDLKTGKGSFSFSVSDPIYEKLKAGNYTISVYDEFQGARLKLANQSYYYDNSAIVITKD